MPAYIPGMADLREWLARHGLEAIAPVLAENDIDLEILPDLTEQDLASLGLSLGHRRKLLKAIGTKPANEPPAPMPATPLPPTIPAADAAPREAERRQVTVMFCDLVGSTELSGRLDPEDLSKLIRRYQDACAGAIARFDGFLAKLMGDGVLAYFGFPQAHEEDAERAVHAALAILSALAPIETPAGKRVQARIGIATGLVVVGDIVGTGVAREQSIVGETPNLAARLQALAAPGTILVSQSTQQLIGRTFEIESAGEHPIKGFAQPVQVWQVHREASIASRFAAARHGNLVPFIGREHEIGLLLDRWRLAIQGEGQIVQLSGEAGMGKSRLVDALRERFDDISKRVIDFQCSPHYVNTALYPMIRHLEQAAGFAFDDTPEQKRAKLKTLLTEAGLGAGMVLPLFAETLSLATDAPALPGDMSPAQRKAATIAGFVDYVIRTSQRQPVLFLLEDAHWIDPTTIELVTKLIDGIEPARVLAIVTARPEFVSSWTGRAHATQLTLNRLGRAQCAEMVATVAAAHAIPPGLLEDIVAKTDGVPLFVEELTRAILEAASPDRSAVPATLQDSLMARLDRLGEAKEIAQIAAVIGRQFSEALLAAVAQVDPAVLAAALSRLIEGGIVFPQSQALETSFSFKHALMRDAAYDSLLRSRRQILHERISHTLEEKFPDIVAGEPELLAYHFGQAGLAEAASLYHERAGGRAVARSAYVEAVAHFSAGLEEARKLPESAAREARELALLLKLSPALSILKGLQSSEVTEVSRAAYALAQKHGDSPERFKATWGLWLSANLGRRTGEALAKADELVALAQRLDDEDFLLEAFHCRWSTGFFRGNFATALEDSREGLERYDAARHHDHGAVYGGHDPGVCARGVQANVLAFLGRGDEARPFTEAAIALAEQLNQPASLAFALMNASMTHQLIGDRAQTARIAARMIEIAETYHFPPTRSVGRFMAAWVRAAGPELADGLAAMEAEFPTVMTLGPIPPYYAALLAETRLTAGKTAEALALVDQTLGAMEDSAIGGFVPELHRLRGESLLRLGPEHREQAQIALQTALDIARRNNDRLVERKAEATLAGMGR